MDDSEEVRWRADALADDKNTSDQRREAIRVAALAELERFKMRVDDCLRGVTEIEGRWKTRISTNHAILDFELQEVVLGKDWLTWTKHAVVRSEGQGVYVFEHDIKRRNLEEALSCIKDRAAYWMVHWRPLVEKCEERNAAAKAKYDQELDERSSNNRAVLALALVIIGGMLWYFLGR